MRQWMKKYKQCKQCHTFYQSEAHCEVCGGHGIKDEPDEIRIFL